jgi:5'-methylthioadenosine phosphorylase
LKSSEKKPEVAIIGGTGLEVLLKSAEQVRMGTQYGLPPPIFLGNINGKRVAFLPRHGLSHAVPPHKVNYRANIHALHQLGVKRIIATNAVGAITKDFKPRDLAIPHDFIDFTRLRPTTFYEDAPVTHVDLSQPYCPEIREVLISTAKEHDIKVEENAVLVCTEGPRLETPAEIEMFRRLGGDLVGMTGVPEAVLSRELEMCYATVCFVTNMAAGMQKRLTALEVSKNAEKARRVVEKLLSETIKELPHSRNCPCANALENARF